MMKKKKSFSEEQMREFEKVIVLRAVDRNGWIISMRWISCVKVFTFVLMDKLIRFVNINLKVSRCLKHVESIEEEVAKYIMKAEIRNNLEREEVVKGQAVNPKEDGEVKKKPVVKKAKLDEMIHVHAAAGKNIKIAMEQWKLYNIMRRRLKGQNQLFCPFQP